MVAEVAEQCAGHIDGLVVAAGIQAGKPSAIVSVNYFGTVATLTGLHSFLAHGTDPSAVVVAADSATTQPGYPVHVAELCLAGDEGAAGQAAGDDALGAYPASKPPWPGGFGRRPLPLTGSAPASG